MYCETWRPADQSVTYRYREFPVPGIFDFFGGTGTGIGKNWYRKKVSVSVSELFGTGKKVSVSVSFKILGTVTHCYSCYVQDSFQCIFVFKQRALNRNLRNIGIRFYDNNTVSAFFDVVIILTPN